MTIMIIIGTEAAGVAEDKAVAEWIEGHPAEAMTSYSVMQYNMF